MKAEDFSYHPRMKVIASFLFIELALAYIDSKKSDEYIIEQNIFTGKYDVLSLGDSK